MVDFQFFHKKKGVSISKKLVNGAHDFVFQNIHSKNLIYNTCWEDPKIDRSLLKIDKESKVVMLTSAGCNALDYLLDSPQEIHTIDMNSRQNALLQLKLRLIEHGTFEELFALFGSGANDEYREIYRKIRGGLPGYAQLFWDKKIDYFDRTSFKKTFYYRGTSGSVAWLICTSLIKPNKRISALVNELIDAPDLEAQKAVYNRLEPSFWNAFSRWLLKHPLLLALLGVPRAQIDLIDKQHPEGVGGFLRDMMRHTFTEVPIADNYFWRVYIKGEYTAKCCPNYLKRENHSLLKRNVNHVRTHTDTLTNFLKENPSPYSHYILLDHQDWLAWHLPDALEEEWQHILKNSRKGTKILLRSASTRIDFIPKKIQSHLRFYNEETHALHRNDRVGTYGSLHFAEVL